MKDIEKYNKSLIRKTEKGKRKIYNKTEIEKERQRDQRDSDILRETERKKN